MESLFRIYSVGYAAENKRPSSHDVEVFCPEVSGYASGEITTNREIIEDSGTDEFGQKYTVKVECGNTILASWLPFGSNRVTPPDIRRGERILVLRYADVDKYYWVDTGWDGFLRRLETAIYAWSGTRDESVKSLTPDNSYYLEVSTHKKHVTFSTSKADGEPFRYVMQINTLDGAMTFADDDGNFIELDSGERRITLKNKDGSSFVLDKRTITAIAPDQYKVQTRDYVVECQTSQVRASATATFTTPQATFTAIVNVNGLANLKGGVAMTGGGGAACNISIPIMASSAATFTGTTTINGKVFATHFHNGVHGPTSPPV